MPIIPSNWTGLDTVNAIGLSGGSGGLTGYAYAKQLTTTITELDTFIDLIGVCNEPISREVSLDLITGRLKLYWKNLDGTYTQLHRDNLIFNTGYKVVDLTLGQLGLSIKCSEVTELFLVVRWDKNLPFDLHIPVVPVSVTVVNDIVTFANYSDIETFTVSINLDGLNAVSWYWYLFLAPQLKWNQSYGMDDGDGIVPSVVTQYEQDYETSIPSNPFQWVINFANIDFVNTYNPVFKIALGFDEYNIGPAIDYSTTLDVIYDKATKTFNVSFPGVRLYEFGNWYDAGGKSINLPLRNKHYQFTVLTSGVITIELYAYYNRDSYLYLLNSNNQIIGENDNSNNISHISKITQTLEPGNYIIVAATVVSGGGGQFKVTVTGKISNLVPN